MLPEVEVKERISEFQNELKMLGGQCHLVADHPELAKLILEIIINAECKIAVIESCIDDSGNIQSTLTNHGVAAIRIQDSQSDILELLSKADVGITHADMAVTQTATLIIRTTKDEDRLASCLPRVHIAIMNMNRLVRKLTDATQYLESNLRIDGPCTVSFISGPSRTSDIEMKQVLGVHGPHEVHVILLR